MLFSFQTPCSEYAQALVDFHHYVFFFFIVITIFVVWMLKFSLLFVVKEKNLSILPSQMRSDFYAEASSLWFNKDGEFYFLIKRFFSYLYNFVITPSTEEQVKMFLGYYLVYLPFLFGFLRNLNIVASYLNVYFFSVVKEESFFQNFGSINYLGKDLFKNTLDSFLLNDLYLNQIYLNLNKIGSRFHRLSVNLFENVVNKDRFFPFFYTSSNFESLQDDNVKKDSTLFSQAVLFSISSVREGLASTRFSHWTHTGKQQPVFLFFTGIGDNYSFDRSGLSSFDLNLYMPQAYFFLDFYKVDLWENPFLFFQNVRHRLVLEWVWTFIPTAILLILVVPSLYLLYSYDRPYVTAPYLTFKAIGHQWYWSYEYFDYIHNEGGLVAFDSYMLHEEDLEIGQLRLLEVDRRVVLPTGVCVRMLTTSSDVLHSWAVPALGVKLDAVPGRLNQFWLVLNKPGVFYGQCSEICGVNHGFMPIAIEAVFLDQYLEFILTYNEAI